MKARKLIAFVILAGALAVAGAGWKWVPGHKGSAAPVSHLAGWTWSATPTTNA